MPTSGTTGLTTLPVDEMVEKACRRCGVHSGSIPGEAARIGKQALFDFLVTTSNTGTNLWVVDRFVLPLTITQTQITLPTSTVGIKAAMYRTFTPPSGGIPFSSSGGIAANAFDQDIETVCTQTAPDGYISYDFGTPVVIQTGGIMSNGDGIYTLLWESSTDNVNWNLVYASSGSTYLNKKFYYYDFVDTVQARYFRVREIGGATLNVREVTFGTNIYETPMTAMNIDNYTSLPTKTMFYGSTSSGSILQYYFDRRRTNPIMSLWPAPSSSFDCLSIWLHMAPQDVGQLTNELDVPVRWVEAVTWALAEKMMFELPREMVDFARLPAIQAKADFFMQQAIDEERNKSPIMLAPNITQYTRW